jgi:hypothetical protein
VHTELVSPNPRRRKNPPEWLAKFDRWRGQQPVPLNRSDAIRRLVEAAIDAETKPKKKR